MEQASQLDFDAVSSEVTEQMQASGREVLRLFGVSSSETADRDLLTAVWTAMEGIRRLAPGPR